MNDAAPTLDFLCELAHAAGAELMQRFRGPLQITRDKRTGPVSDADLAAEALLCEGIQSRFPQHCLIAEEASKKGPAVRQEGPAWVLDPLDGTSNYVQGNPHFAVTISFGEVRGARFLPALGVTYQPASGALFRAERGAGAFLNGERLRLAEDPQHGSLALCPGGIRSAEEAMALWARVAQVAQRAGPLRISGSAALDLAYVAAGWSGAYYGLGLSPWDIAAGALLVAEAGGHASDPESPDALSVALSGGAILASPRTHHPWLREGLGLD